MKGAHRFGLKERIIRWTTLADTRVSMKICKNQDLCLSQQELEIVILEFLIRKNRPKEDRFR